MGPLLLGFAFGLVVPTLIEATTKVTCYDHGNYGGGSVVLDNLEHYSYYYFTHFNDKLTSFRLNRGSCVVMDVDNPPRGTGFWADSSISNVGSQWNDRVSSVMSCGRTTRDIQCPTGTFVKAIEWAVGILRIRLLCYEPKSKTPRSTLHTHPSESFQPQRTDCTGVRGIAFSRDSTKEVDYNLAAVCRPEQGGGNKIVCQGKKALSGMRVEIENYSKHIKVSSLYCRDVGDIEAICNAHDEKTVLFICDATEATGSLRCERAKKIGMAIRSSMSETLRTEYTFYSEYGFELGASGYGLSANFKATIGQSNTTGYDWTRTHETTWEEEVTMTVEIVAEPGCRTSVSEIVGDCSFMLTRPNIFYRNDTCRNGMSVVTEVTIPPGYAGKVFTSLPPTILKDSPLQYEFVEYNQKDSGVYGQVFKPSLVQLSENGNENIN